MDLELHIAEQEEDFILLALEEALQEGFPTPADQPRYIPSVAPRPEMGIEPIQPILRSPENQPARLSASPSLVKSIEPAQPIPRRPENQPARAPRSPMADNELLGPSLEQDIQQVAACNAYIDRLPPPTREPKDCPIYLPVDEKALCWRCGYPGHSRHDCIRTPMLFCSRCGLCGIMSKDCRCDRHPQGVSKKIRPSSSTRTRSRRSTRMSRGIQCHIISTVRPPKTVSRGIQCKLLH